MNQLAKLRGAVAVLQLATALTFACDSSSRILSTSADSADWQGNGWRGTARLVEDLSIGAETGAEPYLFGRITGLATSSDRIFVLDASVSLVRVYSWNGEHIVDIGRKGPGPGEFLSRGFLDVDGQGNVYVQTRQEIEVFTSDGESLATWTLAPLPTLLGPIPLTVDRSGTAYIVEVLGRDPLQPWIKSFALNTYIDGERGTPRPLPEDTATNLVLEFPSDRSWMVSPVPFYPRTVIALSRDGALVVGESSDYTFTRQRQDGSVKSIKKNWDPTPVTTAERDWQLNELREFIRQSEKSSGWELADGLPERKPAFHRFVVGRDDRTWVFRAGPGRLVADCDTQFGQLPCWRDTYVVDVFDRNGVFLGEAALPDEFLNRTPLRTFTPRPDIRGDTMLAVVEDEAGVEYVKRYRLEIPRHPEGE